jgi:hypothetical protein
VVTALGVEGGEAFGLAVHRPALPRGQRLERRHLDPAVGVVPVDVFELVVPSRLST